MNTIKKLPKAKDENLVVQNLDKELLIYDLSSSKAYCLNETSTIVYQACDGQTTIESLKSSHLKLTDEIILLAIDQLQKENLLSEKVEGLSRRALLTKAAFAAVTLPVITSLVAPLAVHAQSCLPRGASCTASSQCCPEFCQFEPGTNFIGCLNGTCRPIQSYPV